MVTKDPIDYEFQKRFWGHEDPRPGDVRDEYQRDRARILHSSAFRRLQAKTQVMGVGEGDFHRTRLTHSIEVAQIGEGLWIHFKRRYLDGLIAQWLPSRDLVLASCYAHDLGHPPFGHGGEQALHGCMVGKGGFEGNGQTLRILTRLEKYRIHQGSNPTRRFVLSVLKYPIPYSGFDPQNYQDKPPKCYLDTEHKIVEWALAEPFAAYERDLLLQKSESGKPKHRSLDASLMECADDIAYGVHDLEDIVARQLVHESEVMEWLQPVFTEVGGWVGSGGDKVSLEDFRKNLFHGDSSMRKAFIGRLVNLFITSAEIKEEADFTHPLLRYRVTLQKQELKLLSALKKLTFKLVIERPEIQQLERRGRRIIEALFKEFKECPTKLIPKDTWCSLLESDSEERRVCDYIAGMTDNYAEKVYRRLFVPGFGSSRDEL